MITMTRDITLTLDEFYRREVALWGFDHIDALLASGWVIVPNEDNGWKWALDDAPATC